MTWNTTQNSTIVLSSIHSLRPNNSFKPSPLRGLGPAESHRAGRLNSGVRPQEKVMSLIENFRASVFVSLFCIACWPLAPTMASDEKTANALGQNASPEEIVDAQLAAYNRRDVEGFLSFYADDAILENHPNQVTQTGKAEMRTRYQRRFSNPNVHAEIIKRVTFGRFVIDHERVVAAPPAEGTLEAVAVYEIKDGKIVRVTFLNN